MAGVRIGHRVMVVHGMALDFLDGLLVNRRARHPEACGNRLERKHGHEQPNEQFFENAVHRADEYSTTFLRGGGVEAESFTRPVPAGRGTVSLSALPALAVVKQVKRGSAALDLLEASLPVT